MAIEIQQRPNIFIYNPTCEIAIANGTVSFMPNKMLQKFEIDLDILPLYFATENDIVLVHKIPDNDFLQHLKSVGIALPNLKNRTLALADIDFISMPKQSLQPWGWSATMHHILRELKPSCCSSFTSQSNAYWHNNQKEFYSRKKALEVLKTVLSSTPNNRFITPQQIGTICKSVAEIELLLKKHHQIVIKTPWSSSGRGLQVLRKSFLNTSIIQWINGSLKEQGYLMVEPLLNKIADFSLQFYIDNKGTISFLDSAYFTTNSNGQYAGNILGRTPEIIQNNISNTQLLELANNVSNALTIARFANNYCGFLGVDCLLFQQGNKIEIHPCLEINLRYNMGILGCRLNKYLHHSAAGEFRIFFNPKRSFADFNSDMQEKYPFKMENNLWKSGYLPLVAPTSEKRFGAYVLINEFDKNR